MAWVFLIIAGLFEICWAIGLKYTEGFSKLWPSVLTLMAMGASMVFLAKAVQTLPIGTAYAIWVGIGALGAAVLGIILFNDALSPAKIIFLAMLLIAVVGLKFTSGA